MKDAPSKVNIGNTNNIVAMLATLLLILIKGTGVVVLLQTKVYYTIPL